MPTCPIQTPTKSNHLPICPSQTTFDVPALSSSGASHPSTTHTLTTLTTHSTPTCTSNNQTRHDDIILVSDSEDDVMECGQQGKNREYHYQPNNATDITRPITIESDFDMLLRQSKATRSCDHSAENMLERSSVTNGTTSGNSKVNPVRLVGLSDISKPSVLGKRKSYERDQHHSDAIGDLENGHSDVFEGDRFDGANVSSFVDNNGPITKPKHHDGDIGEARTVFRNQTFPEGHDLDNGDSCTSKDGLGWCMSKLESGTPLQPSEVEEQEEKLIQDKTLEEFDKILSTAPPEFFSVHSVDDENTTSGQDPCGKNFTASHTTLPDSSAPSLTNCASPGLLQVYSTNSPTISPVHNLTNRSSHLVSTPASNLANRGEAQGETCELTDRGERKDLLLSEVNGVRKEVCTSESPIFDFDLEEDDLQKAMEESLKTQQVHTHTHMYTHTHTHTHTHTCTHTQTRTHTLTHKHVHTHTYTLTHSHVHTHKHVHTHSHTNTYTHTHIHTHTLTLTHTHTLTCTHTQTRTHTLTHKHVHTHTHTHSHTHAYTHTHMYTHSHTHTQTRTHTHTHAYTHTHVHTHTHTLTLTHTHKHVHMHTHTHTHTHKHVHTHIHSHSLVSFMSRVCLKRSN